MRKLLFTCISLLFIFNNISFAQATKGSGKLKTEIIKFSGFKHLILNGTFKVVLVQGDTEEIRINTDDNLVTLFQTNKDKDILYITMLADIKKYEDMTVFISYREIESITLLKNISISSNEVIHFDHVSLFLSGSSRVDAEVFASKLMINQNDQSFCRLKGYSEKLFVDIHDETELNCFGLKSEECEIEATGYTEVMVNCQKTLKLKVTGESNVYYTGEPKITDRIFSSNGFIVKRKNADTTD